MVKLKVKPLFKDTILPTYATIGSACFDLYAHTSRLGYANVMLVAHGWPETIPTGLAFEIPEGHVMLIFSRSGHGFKNDVRLANCVGVIDSDYRGEVQVKLTCDGTLPTSPLSVRHGDRIAQAMVIPIPQVEFELTQHLSQTDRGQGGFGSSGA